jgi:hypothetical protein
LDRKEINTGAWWIRFFTFAGFAEHLNGAREADSLRARTSQAIAVTFLDGIDFIRTRQFRGAGLSFGVRTESFPVQGRI